ncbi:MAG TPA: energy transducer TonB, partial [Saprospiraceae bacterium]|nr:energy transducer TonB [Saprospiraceae bacterium]
MYNEKKERFIKMPVFEGGQKALKQFINENLQYPPEAQKNRIEGTIQVFFIIGTKGKVIEAKVINSLGYGCDEEALRVIKLLEFRIPQTHNIRATFNKKINIHFRLNKEVASEPHKEINIQ